MNLRVIDELSPLYPLKGRIEESGDSEIIKKESI
jgi:hypothetical protein